VYVSYEEAQKLIPVFQWLAKHGPYREVRDDAKAILGELKMVRPISYEPLKGRQIFLTERQYDLFTDVVD